MEAEYKGYMQNNCIYKHHLLICRYIFDMLKKNFIINIEAVKTAMFFIKESCVSLFKEFYVINKSDLDDKDPEKAHFDEIERFNNGILQLIEYNLNTFCQQINEYAEVNIRNIENNNSNKNSKIKEDDIEMGNDYNKENIKEILKDDAIINNANKFSKFSDILLEEYNFSFIIEKNNYKENKIEQNEESSSDEENEIFEIKEKSKAKTTWLFRFYDYNKMNDFWNFYKDNDKIIKFFIVKDKKKENLFWIYIKLKNKAFKLFDKYMDYEYKNPLISKNMKEKFIKKRNDFLYRSINK